MLAKKSMLYNNLFLTYSLVIICLIGGFDLYLINYVMSESKSNRISLGEQLGYNANELLKEIENSNKFIVSSMYYDYMLSNDIIYFLNNHSNDYLKNKLDSFSGSNHFTYNGVERFVASAFISNNKVENIIFLSEKLNEVRSFNHDNQIYIEKIENYETVIQKLPELFFSENKLYHVNSINNPDTLVEEGKLIVVYDLSEVNNIVAKYGANYNLCIYDEQYQTAYLPEDKSEEPSKESLLALSDLKEGEEYKIPGNHQSLFKTKFSDELSVITAISMQNLIEAPQIFYSSILLLDLFLIFVSAVILKWKLEKLTRRTDAILEVMEEVKEGNLKVKIPIGDEMDEISYISQNFNEMCSELDRYINKSYLAEINQKKAEMIALQNQINPHFLYNTLECIRMKAVCNGDKDVGKMLYNLSFLFRKQVKDHNFITLESELEYCTRYMEIFKFRYREKFDFQINCPDELLDNEMIKFAIQPLIENYFMHGIKLEETNNFIEINVSKESENIKVIIDDNGKGIPPEKLTQLNESLTGELCRNTANQSIGIINAHARIVGAYGEGYGVQLDNNSKGARVVIMIPCKRGPNV
ncbi:sensor histidine kinase [Turicibacter sanguinis]|uniref:sensor histidine kinase n=1 Tax=Turicibacter sanguinis TaxID=154288 RepID=UPI0018A9B651|nr:histidine kinase [Turicibacter sanguinis]MDB8551502.1 histidine kinase [Turicibacter sanguinis]